MVENTGDFGLSCNNHLVIDSKAIHARMQVEPPLASLGVAAAGSDSGVSKTMARGGKIWRRRYTLMCSKVEMVQWDTIVCKLGDVMTL